MLIVISPAKTLDYETPPGVDSFSQPEYLDQSQILIDKLRKQTANTLGKLMKISPGLSELNKERYQQWQLPFEPQNAKQAVFAFKGDVYVGLEAENMSKADLDWAQQHLRILSGLYGLFRPLDLMQPYRLEMGTALKVNLASNEYFKSVKPKQLNAEIITPAFLDWKNDEYKMIGFFAKKARGSMSAWIIRNRIEDINALSRFDVDGYKFDKSLSTPLSPVFIRKQ
jgi:cytoplasmic iron level regulating protein YaaA (DUF328/UPF0246 family)